jgi:hypothetical protein
MRSVIQSRLFLQVAVEDGLFQERLRCEVGHLGVLAELLSEEDHKCRVALAANICICGPLLTITQLILLDDRLRIVVAKRTTNTYICR